jgi:transposase-like protein
MMEKRGFHIAHTKIMRWVHQFAPEIDKWICPYLKLITDSFRVDETYIKVKGQWKYLFRAVDSNGNTIDFIVEQDHLKRQTNPMQGFKSFQTAEQTLQGIEALHM